MAIKRLALQQCGIDETGVTPYLDRAAVEATLRKIAGTAEGSFLALVTV